MYLQTVGKGTWEIYNSLQSKGGEGSDSRQMTATSVSYIILCNCYLPHRWAKPNHWSKTWCSFCALYWGVSKLWSDQTHHVFMDCKLKVVFTFLNGWKTQRIFHDLKIIWNSTFSIHRWNFIGTQPEYLFYMFFMAASILQKQNCFRYHMNQRTFNVYYLAHYRKSLSTFILYLWRVALLGEIIQVDW